MYANISLGQSSAWACFDGIVRFMWAHVKQRTTRTRPLVFELKTLAATSSSQRLLTSNKQDATKNIGKPGLIQKNGTFSKTDCFL